MFDGADIFVMADEHSYAAFVGALSSIHMKAHASAPYRNDPYRAVIVVSPSMDKPFRDQPESSLTRLNAINDRMAQPDGGVDVEFHVSDNEMFHPDAKIGLKHPVQHCWPMIYGGDGNLYVTSNQPPRTLDAGSNKVRFFSHKLPGRSIDYNTPIADVFATLDHSKCHVCYQGGTAWLSLAMGIPTIIVHAHMPVERVQFKTKLFGQDTNINILRDGMIVSQRRHPQEAHTTIDGLKAVLRDYT